MRLKKSQVIKNENYHIYCMLIVYELRIKFNKKYVSSFQKIYPTIVSLLFLSSLFLFCFGFCIFAHALNQNLVKSVRDLEVTEC